MPKKSAGKIYSVHRELAEYVTNMALMVFNWILTIIATTQADVK